MFENFQDFLESVLNVLYDIESEVFLYSREKTAGYRNKLFKQSFNILLIGISFTILIFL
jgi:hypothetical protein